ncbi:hypothetical protein WOLCODRAFT_140511 [Wolfiporia cocos MD-104 SS10]|uniref:STE3-domain-containing protein n=1 Tax=Wolfiporia cocos (strain MD-104) TaxID=742152 RepID=A0A2H3JCY0_WOLCO|nr:hypothetical protein WOLCODRAFT_140511 [Wolfiporia cocos MD-104 SS10]
MCSSPATFLTWAVLSVLLGVFLVYHLWRFDRFKCLRWNHGPYSGAFKRVMTYTYLLDVPLIIVYSVGFCVIMYKVGYIDLPGYGVIPMPYALWPEHYKRFIFPLNLVFSIVWSLEMVTHLEELCFWLFLINAGSSQQDWFRSLYFRTWIVGSVLAIIYMPVLTIVTRGNPDKCQAVTFLAGSLGSLSLTFWFLPVLFMFPGFLRNLKAEGVDMNTIVRLTTFHEMNCARIVFRFLFCAPLLILGADGLTSRYIVNSNIFASEFLAFVAAVGCVFSSGLTLLIFFPRSVATEIQAHDSTLFKQPQQMQTLDLTKSMQSDRDSYFAPAPPPPEGSAPPYSSVAENMTVAVSDESGIGKASTLDPERAMPALRTFAPNRRLDSGATVEGGVIVVGLTEGNLARHNLSANVHPFVHNFRSPIELMQTDSYQGITRYGVTRHYA